MENHDLGGEVEHRGTAQERCVRDLLEARVELLGYHYFGQNVVAPDEAMAAIGRALSRR